MEKALVRLEKYATWFLVNFVVCLLPIVISALISWKINDNVFVSYISFAYTLLISGLYVYFNSNRGSDFTIWLAMFFTFLFLVLYVVFPNVLRQNIVVTIRNNYISYSLGVFVMVLLMSFILHRRDIEDQVQTTISQRAQERATQIGENVNNMRDELNKDPL